MSGDTQVLHGSMKKSSKAKMFKNELQDTK